MRAAPEVCMRRASAAFHDWQADRVVAEVNNGGDYIGTLLHAVDPGVAYRAVRATRGKATRAEPVSALYEQHRVHHLGSFPQLEDQLCSWAPADPESPDRLDACVWAFHDLKDLISGSWADAYGVTKCVHCDVAYLREIDGRPRTVCPHCGRPVTEAA
jgi:phage terminase large subunit-like protein